MKLKVVLPILGFEDEKEYELNQIDDIFYQLKGKKSIFTCINPFKLMSNYDFEIDDESTEKLKLGEDKEILVLNTMVVNNPFLESTINLAAPIIVNLTDKLLGQVILSDYNYSLEEPLKNFVKEK